MFQGLSLEQAPPYKLVLKFYITAGVYLVLFTLLGIALSFGIENKYQYEAIALTHTLTIGFFSFVMFGSMFQMIPVMLGIAYKDVLKRSNIIYILLHVGLISFLIGFLTNTTFFLHVGGVALLGAFVTFSYISFNTVFESVEKDFLVRNFALAFVTLFLASIFGFFALMGHFGFVDTLKYGDIHIALMLFGWVFFLVNAVSFKIIPMFFVAKEFPDFIKNYFYIIVSILLLLFIYLRLQDSAMLLYIKILLVLCVITFALTSIHILKNRKRARSDSSVTLWYFAMTNTIIASLFFLASELFGFQAHLFIAFFTLFGGVYALINAMLYKIVPFLTWFHLSSNMVFDAEMSDVIPKKAMQKQTYMYYIAYTTLLVGIFFKPLFVIGFGVLFLSSILLIKNIIQAKKYYDIYIKKKVDMGDFTATTV
jgi:hypothetical protein